MSKEEEKKSLPPQAEAKGSVDTENVQAEKISDASKEAVSAVLLDARGEYSREKDGSISVDLTKLLGNESAGDYLIVNNRGELQKEAEVIMYEILANAKSTKEIVAKVNTLLSSLAKLFFLDPQTVVPGVKMELKTYEFDDDSIPGKGLYLTIDGFNIAKTSIDENGKIIGSSDENTDNFIEFLKQFIEKVKQTDKEKPIQFVDWEDSEVTLEEYETSWAKNFLK